MKTIKIVKLGKLFKLPNPIEFAFDGKTTGQTIFTQSKWESGLKVMNKMN